MPRACAICDKHVLFGHKISHSNIKSPKLSHPNLQRVRIKIGNAVRRAMVCTRCIRSGKAQKAA